MAAGIALTGGRRVLDMCAGTLDLSIELKKADRGAFIVASDFCFNMLREGKKKLKPETSEKSLAKIDIACADSLMLPFRDKSFDAVTVAFGIRNIRPPETAVGEMARVIREGGRIVILEFYKPEGVILKYLFLPYLKIILPFIGRLVSGDKSAYSYLKDSVVGFISRAEMSNMLLKAGFKDVEYRDLSFGVATIHTGIKGAQVLSRY